MLVVNPAARSFSPDKAEIIRKVLEADFKTEVATTARRTHATQLAAEAVDRDFDAVIALGGDGTMNEVVQALAGTDVALGILPGGLENVMARSLGLPLEPIAATAYLSLRLHSGTSRRIKLGKVDNRYFVFAAGMGVDAEVVKASERDPSVKRELGEWAFVWAALRIGLIHYAHRPPRIEMTVDGHELQRVAFAVCCNARPFTYFRGRPVDACPQASLETDLDIFSMTRLAYRDVARLVWALLYTRSHPRWRAARYFHDVPGVRLRADTPLPVQVDGDYIGDRREVRIDVVPDALSLLT